MIKLVSDTYTVKKIKKKTKAKLFGEIKEGDLIRFKMHMQYRTNWGRGVYASMITVENITRGISDSSKTQSEVVKILERCFDIVKTK